LSFANLETEQINENLTITAKVDGFDAEQTTSLTFKGISQIERAPYLLSINQIVQTKTETEIEIIEEDGEEKEITKEIEKTTYITTIKWTGCAKFGSGKKAYFGNGFGGYKVVFQGQEFITHEESITIESEQTNSKLTIEQINTFNPHQINKLEVYI